MKAVKVEVVNKSNNELPVYETDGAAAMDVRCSERFELLGGETGVIKTGLFVAIPEGYEIQVRPRSGLAAKKSITVLNSPGTIDSDYRGEIMVILHNSGESVFTAEEGERIAQLRLAEVPRIKWQQLSNVEDLSSTERGAGGFGSTGTN